jgi:hypothetical protein
MKRQYAGNQSSARRNPFDVMDVPNPNDQEVQEFATGTKLEGTPDDENRHGRPRATAINTARSKEVWSSSWNGRCGPHDPERCRGQMETGSSRSESCRRPYLSPIRLGQCGRRGLIDARREGTRLVGRYINLTGQKVTRPWIGVIVSNQRIERWTGGRLDFRR